MRTPKARRNLVAILICAFVAQTGLVYLDRTGREMPPLSPLAQEGQQLWHDNNCQSCHQIYGFGGFLGPDLTNAAQRLPRERLDAILTDGQAPMPAFHLSEKEIDAIEAFLKEVDKTGVGQLLLTEAPPPAEALAAAVKGLAASAPLTADSRVGYRIIRDKQCLGCHLPNAGSTVHAPDLCNVIRSPGPETILATVARGRPEKGMPAFQFTDDEKRGLLAFLEWMHENAEPIRAALGGAKANEESSIPWFEYPR